MISTKTILFGVNTNERIGGKSLLRVRMNSSSGLSSHLTLYPNEQHCWLAQMKNPLTELGGRRRRVVY